MTSPTLTESVLEQAALSWLESLGYTVLYGPEVAPDTMFAERTDFGEAVLTRRLRDAIARLNPDIPAEAQEDALRKLLRADSPLLVDNNRVFHQRLTDGVEVEYRTADGRIKGDLVRLVDFAHPESNDFLAVNQFTVKGDTHNHRPDIVIFLNGLPVGVVELKNPAEEQATVKTAFNQLQTYKAHIPSLFNYNEALIVSDGTDARIGSLTANFEWFLPWRTIGGEEIEPPQVLALEVLLKGVFAKERLLEYLRHFVVFEEDRAGLVKKLAGYHQFHAVRRAIAETLKASAPEGDRRVGVVWHTQGAGKSLTMVFFAGAIAVHPQMHNPTVVVITDRIDLDDQLFGTFSRCHLLLRQPPEQAKSRDHLQELLQTTSGGVIFTTAQKCFPEEQVEQMPVLSDRRNIVVIADEAHRSQYDFIDGFARHIRDALPNASFAGFTGTPLELEDRNTPAVFGDYISIYDIEQAVVDGATVPIYYEGRLAKIDLSEDERPRIDPEFEEVTEKEEDVERERLKSKWARLEAIVGADKRVALIATDLLDHFADRQAAMEGKAMVVCMSRRICVEMYQAIIKLRPEWHSDDNTKGMVKVVMTGSASDPLEWQPHIGSKARREALAERFKNPDDPLKIVLVRDMWLTGFDVPCLHTMYVDKPMRAHGLMQAIARVNRVFRDKPGGLVVDYIGIAEELKTALHRYTASGGKGKTAIDVAEVVAVMQEKYEILTALFNGFDYSGFFQGEATERIQVLPAAQEHILAREEGKERFLPAATDLTKAFALAPTSDFAHSIRDDLAFFQAVRAAIAKTTRIHAGDDVEVELAIRQIISGAVVTEGVVDIFSAAGLQKPDISILSDKFLEEVRHLPQRNLAVELLERLLSGELRKVRQRNLMLSRLFSEMLEEAIRKYRSRTIESAQVIAELIDLAKEMRDSNRRGDELKLTEEELAFYDALETNDSAVKILGDEVLCTIARELVAAVRKNATIDWAVRESIRAKLRVLVKRILKKHGYPPDKQEQATLTVLEQAELLCGEVAA